MGRSDLMVFLHEGGREQILENEKVMMEQIDCTGKKNEAGIFLVC